MAQVDSESSAVRFPPNNRVIATHDDAQCLLIMLKSPLQCAH